MGKVRRTVGLFTEGMRMALQDFERQWHQYQPNVALSDGEWQKEFARYLRQGCTAPVQEEAISMGAWQLAMMRHPLYNSLYRTRP